MDARPRRTCRSVTRYGRCGLALGHPAGQHAVPIGDGAWYAYHVDANHRSTPIGYGTLVDGEWRLLEHTGDRWASDHIHIDIAPLTAGRLRPGMVIDYSPYSTWGSSTEWDTPMVAAHPVEVEPGLVEIQFIGGPPPLRLAPDWPITEHTPAMSDLHTALVMEELERLGFGRSSRPGTDGEDPS